MIDSFVDLSVKCLSLCPFRSSGKKGGKGKKGASARSGSKQGGGKGAAGGGWGSGSGAAVAGGVTLSWLAAQLPGWCPDLEWEEGGGGGGGAEDRKAVAVAKLLVAGAEVAYEEALQVGVTALADCWRTLCLVSACI